MSWTSTGAGPARSSPRQLRIAAIISAAAAATVGLLAASGGTAVAEGGSDNGPPPVVTRAALDPSLVASRGADLGFLQQRAVDALADGTIIGPSTNASMLPAE